MTGRKPVFPDRSAGVLLHLTSLPGPYGVGDLGPEAAAFADWLASAGQRWWQTLPVGPEGAGRSPYHSTSAFAGSPLLIGLGGLVEDGLLGRRDVHHGPKPPPAVWRADLLVPCCVQGQGRQSECFFRSRSRLPS